MEAPVAFDASLLHGVMVVGNLAVILIDNVEALDGAEMADFGVAEYGSLEALKPFDR